MLLTLFYEQFYNQFENIGALVAAAASALLRSPIDIHLPIGRIRGRRRRKIGGVIEREIRRFGTRGKRDRTRQRVPNLCS